MRVLDYVEVHWWIKDSTQRARIKGVDIVKDIHLENLKLISSIDALDDFDESWALNCLQEYGST